MRRKVLAGNEHQGLVVDQRHWREILHDIVRRLLVKPLALGEAADVSDHELIPVRRSLRYAAAADQTAGPGDVLDDNGLAELGAQSVRHDTPYGVARSARRKWNNQCYRPCRPILRGGRRNADQQCRGHCDDSHFVGLAPTKSSIQSAIGSLSLYTIPTRRACPLLKESHERPSAVVICCDQDSVAVQA